MTDMERVIIQIFFTTNVYLKSSMKQVIQEKLISCLYGRFYLVVVDCKKDSKQFLQWESFELSDLNREQVLIPPGFGNGHLVLSDRAIFHYKQSTYYERASQFTYLWDDPAINISWPTSNPILSVRDSGGE